MKLTLEDAKRMIEAAEKKAEEIGVPMVIAVVDDGANLIALHKMDDALLVSITIATDKAYTAAATKLATHELAKLCQPGQPIFGLNSTVNGRVIIFGGGLPIKAGGKVVGGIGVSGGSVEEDQACAEAGLAAFTT